MPVLNLLSIVLGLGSLACGAGLLRVPSAPASALFRSSGSAQPPGQQPDEAASIKLFCFAFIPRRPTDEDKLPESRLQLQECDGHLFFTDEEAPGAPSDDIVRIKVPKQASPRNDPWWLSHKNMAALTPAWTYLLAGDRLAGMDWVLNVEVDHFVRPSKVRSAIRETLKILRQGSEWERRFFEAPNGTPSSNSSADGGALTKPVMLALGNAFAASKAMVAEMRRQWPLPGLTALAGCPEWSPNFCEQDVVYRDMLTHFRPPIQLFGSAGCGKVMLTQNSTALPLMCWEFFQNPDAQGPGVQTEQNQIQGLHTFVALGGGPGPATHDSPQVHVEQLLRKANQTKHVFDGDMNLTHEPCWPSLDIPLMHHAYNGKVLREARRLLGL